MAWRYALAIGCSLLFMLVWFQLFPPVQAPRRAALPPAAQVKDGAGPAPGAPEPRAGGDAEKLPPPPAEASRPEATTPRRPAREPKTSRQLLGEMLAVEAQSLGGGSLAAVELPSYHRDTHDASPYRLLLEAPTALGGTLGLELEDPHKPIPEPWIPFSESWDLQTGVDERGLPTFVFSNEIEGVEVHKIVSLGGPEYPHPEDPSPAHHLKVRIEIKNTSSQELGLHYRLLGPAAIDSEDYQNPGADLLLEYGTWNSRGEVVVDSRAPAKMTGGSWEEESHIAWVGTANQYFTSVLFPLSAPGAKSDFVDKAFGKTYPDSERQEALAKELYQRPLAELNLAQLKEVEAKAFQNLRVGLRSRKVSLLPGQSAAHEYGLYLGPRADEFLEPYSALNFQGINHYGTFSFLTKLFIRLLGWLKLAAFGSWGVAIVLLTLIVKLCLHPINRRSQAGMHRFQKKMQKVKPEMDALKERYGSNRLKLNTEIQKLWKEHDINPTQQMAGCLLIFLQLPVWWGLYSTLRFAIGLRQAPFLWIDDLTAPDRILTFGSAVPIIGTDLNLLPILYVVLTIIQQRMQPKPDDPQMQAQHRMMSFMMVFFGYILYGFPAGFMLYIMTSALLGIIESKIIKAELARAEASGPVGSKMGGAAGGAGSAGGALYPARSSRPQEREPGKGRGRG